MNVLLEATKRNEWIVVQFWLDPAKLTSAPSRGKISQRFRPTTDNILSDHSVDVLGKLFAFLGERAHEASIAIVCSPQACTAPWDRFTTLGRPLGSLQQFKCDRPFFPVHAPSRDPRLFLPWGSFMAVSLTGRLPLAIVSHVVTCSEGSMLLRVGCGAPCFLA